MKVFQRVLSRYVYNRSFNQAEMAKELESNSLTTRLKVKYMLSFKKRGIKKAA